MDKPIIPTIYYKNNSNMENSRMYRNVNDATKMKISQSLKGRSKTEDHKQAIARGLSNYWKNIPTKPDNDKGNKVEGF